MQVVTWNEPHQKLTSSDQFGLIIVWMLYKVLNDYKLIKKCIFIATQTIHSMVFTDEVHILKR